ncbi:MAG: rhodanese-like domain-containing protein [Rubritepida sp.]|nr:rhodanese-like domain-containing protein [Rubritepida sp.]
MPLSRRIALAAALAALTPASAFALWPRRGLADPSDPRTTLDQVERDIARLIPVREITPRDLAVRLGEYLLFDVREEDEFAMSHLPGAIRLAPRLSATEFLAAHGARTGGAQVVFYCAVGWRSGKMLERVQAIVARARPAEMYNLRGGLFRWRAEGLPLEGGAEVHPFDAAWGQLLRRTLAG